MAVLQQVIFLVGDNRGQEEKVEFFFVFGHFELKLGGNMRELSYSMQSSAIFRCDVRLSNFERVRR